MKLKAAIFDLDGTLLNTLDDLATAVNISLHDMGFELRSKEEVAAALGNGYQQLIHKLVPEGTDSIQEKATLELFRKNYMAHAIERTAPYQGIHETLVDIANLDMYRAVVSNKGDQAVQALVAEFFPGFFNVVVGERAGVRRKPAPDTLLTVMNELELEADEVIYIGDSEVDIETARNAGVQCVAVSWGFRTRAFLEELKPDFIIDSPEELIALLH